MKKFLMFFLFSAIISCDQYMASYTGNGYTTENYYGEWEGDG